MSVVRGEAEPETERLCERGREGEVVGRIAITTSRRMEEEREEERGYSKDCFMLVICKHCKVHHHQLILSLCAAASAAGPLALFSPCQCAVLLPSHLNCGT
jgi:hypothetical protein